MVLDIPGLLDRTAFGGSSLYGMGFLGFYASLTGTNIECCNVFFQSCVHGSGSIGRIMLAFIVISTPYDSEGRLQSCTNSNYTKRGIEIKDLYQLHYSHPISSSVVSGLPPRMQKRAISAGQPQPLNIIRHPPLLLYPDTITPTTTYDKTKHHPK
jgi:hypothetical protein